MNGLTGVVYGYDFSLSLLQKYPGKWSHTWRKLMSLGGGRVIEMISLHFIYTFVLSG